MPVITVAQAQKLFLEIIDAVIEEKKAYKELERTRTIANARLKAAYPLIKDLYFNTHEGLFQILKMKMGNYNIKRAAKPDKKAADNPYAIIDLVDEMKPRLVAMRGEEPGEPEDTEDGEE